MGPPARDAQDERSFTPLGLGGFLDRVCLSKILSTDMGDALAGAHSACKLRQTGERLEIAIHELASGEQRVFLRKNRSGRA
jgi:hypothetical protein